MMSGNACGLRLTDAAGAFVPGPISCVFGQGEETGRVDLGTHAEDRVNTSTTADQGYEWHRMMRSKSGPWPTTVTIRRAATCLSRSTRSCIERRRASCVAARG